MCGERAVEKLAEERKQFVRTLAAPLEDTFLPTDTRRLLSYVHELIVHKQLDEGTVSATEPSFDSLVELRESFSGRTRALLEEDSHNEALNHFLQVCYLHNLRLSVLESS